MINKTNLALVAVLLLQMAPAAEAASKHHHDDRGARSAYDYESGPSPAYEYAREAFGWNGGLYPFNLTDSGRPTPLRSDGKCWVPTHWGNPQWGPCP